MLKRLLLTLAVAAPLAATSMLVTSSPAEAQWGPPPSHWGAPPPRHWGGPPPRHWGWRPPPPRCWMERQRVWVDGPWGPRRVWQNVRVCR